MINKKILRFVQLHSSPLPFYALMSLSAYFIFSYLFIAVKSIFYPFQLEWLEGASMDVVQQVLQGLPIYTKPTLEYATMIYTPLYFYITALFTYVLGNDFLAGRMVSFCSISIACVILYKWLRKEGAEKHYGILAAAVFIATYQLSGNWFHIARVDSLFLMLTLSGLFFYFYYHTPRSAAFAGILLTLAFFTKQQALLILIPTLLLGLISFPGKTFITFFTFVVFSALGIAVFQHNTNGWFGVYVFQVPWIKPVTCRSFFDFWQFDMLQYLPIALGFSAAGIMAWFSQGWRKGLFYLGFLGGAMGTALASRMHCGGYLNVLMPAYAAICLVCVLSIYEMARRNIIHKNLCYILLLAQMLILVYNPLALTPHSGHFQAGNKHLNYIAGIPGEVFIPDMRFIQTKAGKKSYSLGLDIRQAESVVRHEPFVRDQLKDALKHQRFSALILGSPRQIPEKNAYYVFKEKIFYHNESYLLTGMDSRPNYVFVPIPHNTQTKEP